MWIDTALKAVIRLLRSVSTSNPIEYSMHGRVADRDKRMLLERRTTSTTITAASEQPAPKTQEELKQVIERVWDELDQTVLNRLILGFNKRLEMVIKVHGGRNPQYLSSHRNGPTAEDAAANPDVRPFGQEEDAAILEGVKRQGTAGRESRKSSDRSL
jgi:hypothetical protein